MVRPPGKDSATDSAWIARKPAVAAGPSVGTSVMEVGSTTMASAAGGVTAMVRLVVNVLPMPEQFGFGAHDTTTRSPSSASGLMGTCNSCVALLATSIAEGLLDVKYRPMEWSTLNRVPSSSTAVATTVVWSPSNLSTGRKAPRTH